MPFSTANYKLHRMIIFYLLIKLNENVCFKCGKIIDTLASLTIEHKIPWLHSSPGLFWDLENIAFSHLTCNRPDRPYLGKHRKIGPVGTAWCYKHQDFLPQDKFSKDNSSWNKLRDLCREHDHYWKKKHSRVV